jgi:Uma2 family endonuclease
MVGAMALFPIDEPRGDERVLLHNVSWAGYVSMRESLARSVRLTYLHGLLEIMTVGHVHEVTRTLASRLIELFCLERDIPLFSYGHETQRREEAEIGLEPDVWYHRGPASRIPDIAIEVIVTNPLLDKLEVYAGLGVREVWVIEKGVFRILALGDGEYRAIETSAILPELDLARIAHYAVQQDQHAALVAFRTELRKS